MKKDGTEARGLRKQGLAAMATDVMQRSAGLQLTQTTSGSGAGARR